jgi:RNA polymerase primary sigma factor
MSKNKEYGSDIVMSTMYREIANTSPISKQEEKAYFELYHRTDDNKIKHKIKEKVIQANLRFALQVALQYSGFKDTPTSDFYSEAKLGLVSAFDKFDHTRDIKFISFAVWHIKLNVSKYLIDNDTIRIPANKKNKINKLLKKHNFEDLLKEDTELAQVYSIYNGCTSLDSHSNDDGESFLHETIKDDSMVSAEKLRLENNLNDHLNTILDSFLNTEESKVISVLHGLDSGVPMGLRDATDVIGKSHERIRQIRDKSYLKIRKSIGTKALRQLFDDYVEE